MNYLVVELRVVRSPEYVGCEPLRRATWLNVACWCADQENGGRIRDCKSWGDRRWMQSCGVTKAEVHAAAPLLQFEGADLVVFGYPVDREAGYQAKCAASVRGVEARRRLREEAAPQQVDPQPALEGVPALPAKRHAPGGVSSYADISDTSRDAVWLALQVTGDKSTNGEAFLRRALPVIGDRQFRALLSSLWGELQKGERPSNPAAVFTARVKKAMDRRVS